MALEPEFLETFTQTLRVYRHIGTSDYGQDSYATDPDDIPCHINGRVTEMLTETGEATLSTGMAYIDITPWLTSEASAYVPELSADDGWRRVNIIGVQTTYDGDGPHHMVVYFGER